MKIKTAIFATLLLTGCDLKELGIDIPKPPEDLERQTVKIHVVGANGVGAEDKPCLSLQVDVNVKGKTPFTFSSPTILGLR